MLRFVLTFAFLGLVGCGSDALEPEPVVEIALEQLSIGELVFDVRTAGPADAPVVILLHGFPQTSYEWRHQLRALGAAGYRAVAPDQRGYSPGARPADVADYNIVNLIGDVLGIADVLGADRFHLVGHDWGAAVSWGVARVAPDRIISLTPVSIPHPDAFNEALRDPGSCQSSASGYFDTFILPDSEDILLANDAAFLRAIYTGLSDEAVSVYLEALGTKEALGAGLNWYRANITDRQFPGPAVGSIDVPVMFIWSDGDSAVCREPAERTGDFVSGPYRFEVIEGVSHWVPELAAERVNELLLEHLAE